MLQQHQQFENQQSLQKRVFRRTDEYHGTLKPSVAQFAKIKGFRVTRRCLGRLLESSYRQRRTDKCQFNKRDPEYMLMKQQERQTYRSWRMGRQEASPLYREEKKETGYLRRRGDQPLHAKNETNECRLKQTNKPKATETKLLQLNLPQYRVEKRTSTREQLT